MDGHQVVLKQANSDRPAFLVICSDSDESRIVGVADRDAEDNDVLATRTLSYTYCSMGLEKQHDAQLTI